MSDEPLTIRDVLDIVAVALEAVGMDRPDMADVVRKEINEGLKENGLTLQLVRRSGCIVVKNCRRKVEASAD